MQQEQVSEWWVSGSSTDVQLPYGLSSSNNGRNVMEFHQVNGSTKVVVNRNIFL